MFENMFDVGGPTGRRGVFSLTACGLLAAAIGSAANADTIQLSYQYVSAGGTLSGVLNHTDYTNTSNADGIQYMATANAVGALASMLPSNIWVACRQLGQSTDFPFNTYNVGLLSNSDIGKPKADLIGQLWAKHYDHNWNNNNAIYVQGFVGGQPANTVENQTALAFIYAIYAIRYNFDGTAGSLTVSNNALSFYQYADTNPSSMALTNAWLADLDLNYAGPLPTLVDLTNDNLQDVIVEIPAPGVAGLLAFTGIVGLRRRR